MQTGPARSRGCTAPAGPLRRAGDGYADNIDTTVILIAGTQLAELMIDYGVGVTTDATYEGYRHESCGNTR